MHAFEVLADPVRRRILEVLRAGESTSGDVVTVIQREFGITQAAVSQHLKVLRENGFARVRPDGARRYYTLETTALREASQWLDGFRGFWTQKLEALATEIERGKRAKPRTTGTKRKQEKSA